MLIHFLEETMNRLTRYAAAFIAAGLLCAAPRYLPAADEKPHADHHADAAKGAGAMAHIKGFGAGKDKVKGHVTFTQMEGGVKVVAHIEGLAPGKHGFHLHEKPIEGDDPKSAGGHWNPGKHDHGGPDAPAHHAGDLGNITADEKGVAHLEVTLKGLTIAAGDMSVVGKSVIVHEKEDDLKSQPAGNAGDRIGGGTVEAAKAEKPEKK
jgi:Cu-Zn family superoxide dismutase